MDKNSQRDLIADAAEKFVEAVKETNGLKRGGILYWFYDEKEEETMFGVAGKMTYPESLGVAQHFVHHFTHSD